MSQSVLTPGSQAKYRNANRPHYVYEFWADDVCLYVGCTVQPAGRIANHTRAPWWSKVTRIVANVYPDKDTGREVETELIHRLDPIWNWQQTDKARGPRGS